jgi:hypothetical protein
MHAGIERQGTWDDLDVFEDTDDNLMVLEGQRILSAEWAETPGGIRAV